MNIYRYKRYSEKKRERKSERERKKIEGSMDRWKTRRKYICKKY